MKNLPIIAFALSCFLVLFGGGVALGLASNEFNLWPSRMAKKVYEPIKELLNPSDNILRSNVSADEPRFTFPLPEAAMPGLVVVSAGYDGRETAVRVMTREGETVQEWKPSFHDVWPSGEGSFPPDRRPVEGQNLHGLVMLDDGSIVANFEHLSTFRMDVCGNALWKLDNLGHHSVELGPEGTIWVSAEDYYSDSDDVPFPNHVGPLRSYTAQEISIDGEVIRTIPLIELLDQGDYEGLLTLSSLAPHAVRASGDTLHLNDVQPFPADMEPGVFGPGDIILSLRNINSIVVVNLDDGEIKFVSTGRLLRHHDPDFVSGDVITVFDNRLVNHGGRSASRIVDFNGRTGEMEVILDGATSEPKFFTLIMGSHEVLANGNRLVVQSRPGRLLEFTPDGRLVWSHTNKIGETNALRIYNAFVLPEEMDAEFFADARAACGG